MKKIGGILFISMCALLLTNCGAPPANNGGNSNANSNANTTKPTAAAPTADSLMAMEKQANEAYLKGDGKFFDGFLGDKFVMYGGGMRAGKATVVDMISKVKCDSTDFKLEEPQMTMIDADTYAITYKGTYSGKCTADGKEQPNPSPTRAATVWVRNGDKWAPVFHGENLIIDPKNPPKAPAKPAAPKKDDKSTAKSNSNSNSNSAAPPAPALPAKSANTDAIAAVEKSGWQAWMAKDATKLDAVTGKNIAIVNPDGSTMNDRAAIIKYWTDMPCKDVKNVDVKDPYSVALSPTVEMLTFSGVADGTCFDQKNTPMPSMSIYVKDGDAWKLAFAFGGQADGM